MIPLDGTKLSEHAFALLPLIVQLGFSDVVLVQAFAGARQGPARKEATSYLEDCVRRLQGFDLETRLDARCGRPADQIVRAAQDHDVDLILMATHGRDGIERWRLGSVADEVVREAQCPALLIGPNVKASLSPYQLRRILVPLDGSRRAGCAATVATCIAQRADASLDLVQVAPFVAPTSVWGYAMDARLEQRKSIGPYLEELTRNVPDGVPVNTEVLFGETSEQLIAYAHRTELVVLVSHTRSGLLRTVLGSVADRLLHGPVPVLVLKPDTDTSRRI
jgi:nucleotide-binding universal stress UspA family protein